MSYIISEFRKLKPRPGAAEMISILREGGFEVRCCSDANVERLKGYFDAAGIDMPLEHIYSADEVSAGKPEAAVYKMARGKVGADEKGAVSIFAAAHAWVRSRVPFLVKCAWLIVAARLALFRRTSPPPKLPGASSLRLNRASTLSADSSIHHAASIPPTAPSCVACPRRARAPVHLPSHAYADPRRPLLLPLSQYERDPCEAIFGKADLTSETLVGMAQGIVERWGKK